MSNKAVSIILSLSLLLVAIATAYYLIYYIPQKRVQLHRSCEEEAYKKATDSAKSEMELAEGTGMYDFYKERVDKGMYRKDDYNYYYERCLTRYNLN